MWGEFGKSVMVGVWSWSVGVILFDDFGDYGFGVSVEWWRDCCSVGEI